MSKAQLQYSTPSSSKLSIKKEDDTTNNDTLRAADLLANEPDDIQRNADIQMAANDDEEADSSKFQDYYGIVVESK